MIKKINSYALNNISGGALTVEDKEFADWFYSKKPILEAFLALPWQAQSPISIQGEDFKQTFNGCVKQLNYLNKNNAKILPESLRKNMYNIVLHLDLIEEKMKQIGYQI